MFEGTGEHGCRHYHRHCRLKAPCCDRLFPCRLCHNDDPLPCCPLEMERTRVTHVQCDSCNLVQLVNEGCRRCGQRFGLYFCPLCRLFDDDTSKKQYHCHGCKICRVGPQENFTHCDRCRVCYGSHTYPTHKCVDNAMGIISCIHCFHSQRYIEGNCPVCLECLHTSTRKYKVLSCGHILHRDCYQSLLQNSSRCPVCNKSLLDMKEQARALDAQIALTPMPEEYQNMWMYSLCNDCQDKTFAKFHIVGHKCCSCGSYNTSPIAGPTRSSEQGQPPPLENITSNEPRAVSVEVSSSPVENPGYQRQQAVGSTPSSDPDQHSNYQSDSEDSDTEMQTLRTASWATQEQEDTAAAISAAQQQLAALRALGESTSTDLSNV